MSGKKLLSECDSRTRSLCSGFVVGVADTSFVLNMAPYCTPTSVTPTQLQRVATKWLHAHPEQLRRDAAFLVMTALEEAFPCEQKK